MDTATNSDTLVMVPGYGMGQAEDDLRLRLLETWLRLVLEDGRLPGALALYTEGVRLATEGSPVVELLETFEARGTHVILCRTCLEHFGLLEKVAVGVVGGMGDILAAQTIAKKVMTL